MKKMKHWVILIAVLLASYLAGESIMRILHHEPVQTTYIMGFVLALMVVIEGFTWDMDFKRQKDEMGKKIAGESAKITHYVLVVSLYFMWIGDRILFSRVNDFGNTTLFFALCFALVLYPVVCLIVSRKYQ